MSVKHEAIYVAHNPEISRDVATAIQEFIASVEATFAEDGEICPKVVRASACQALLANLIAVMGAGALETSQLLEISEKVRTTLCEEIERRALGKPNTDPSLN